MREWLNTTGREYAPCDDVVEFSAHTGSFWASLERMDEGSAYHCVHCGWEGYFLIRLRCLNLFPTIDGNLTEEFDRKAPMRYWEYKKICERMDAVTQKASRENSAFKKNPICPCCGKKILKDGSSLHFAGFEEEGDDWDYYGGGTKIVAGSSNGVRSNEPILDINDIFEKMRMLREAARAEEVQDAVERVVRSFDLPAVRTADMAKIAEVKANHEKLKEYVQQLLKLESAIYLEQQRLEQLLQTQADVAGGAMRDEYITRKAVSSALVSYEAECDKCEKAVEMAKGKRFEPVTLGKPRHPAKPMLRKPNFFNRKKVEEENRRLTEEYERAFVKWQEEIARIEAEEHRQNEEKKAALAAEQAAAAKALENAQAALEAKRAELKANGVVSKVETYRCEAVDAEIEQSKKTLQELFKCRNELYACDIVFPKYRSLVALSVICEYLMTGRCSALEGADGAYNLYESELRSNLIIAELAIVIESLEQVKQNQYMLYSEMQSINASLSAMHATMVDMHRTLECIEGNTEVIAQNTAVVAHNTAVAAHYAKVNAELTNALGFLVALK